MELDALRIFITVAKLSSFTRAAEQLGLPKARVSTAVQQLEAELGARLLHRTTRSVRLTPDGEQFLDRCKALLADADEVQALFQQGSAGLRGRLRVDLPVHIACHMVLPRLPEFIAAHPQLEIELSTTDRRVDLVHEGFDCLLRVGSLSDSGLVARRLGTLAMVNVASPAYLAAYGVPHTLDDLDAHRQVRYAPTLGGAPGVWDYRDGDQCATHPMASVITVTHTDAYQAACLAGLGLIQVPLLSVRALIAEGRLVEVLPAFVAEPMPVSLMYPNRRNLSKRVQAFMAWLAEILAPALA